MLNQREDVNLSGYPYECGTVRQHFNHLRNNSSKMRGILSWGGEEQIQLNRPQVQVPAQNPQNYQRDEEDHYKRSKRNVSFDVNQNIEHNASKNKSAITTSDVKKATPVANNNSVAQNRPKSASKPIKRPKQDDEDVQIRNRIREKQVEQQASRKDQRREKVKKYIQDLKPYTRSLTNTKYQDFFDKAALESYGRANLKNAIGGIIYGNHQKTFNMNPHIRGNQPKYYQTHQTAINYGKRTKLSEQDKWKRLEKELTSKLGLKDKNETLKEGKQVVYVDVDDSNMYSVMKQNLAFKKDHDSEIRKLEKDYKEEIEKEKQNAIEQYYANKKDRILNGNTIDSEASTYVCPRDQRGRLQEQVVFRHTDKDGVVRLGADRHALTCFVDMNFPENDAAYTQELINRMPIFPIQVEDKDKFIDDQRRNNYKKSLQNIYPSHYLLPNCDQPEVIKMINAKYGQSEGQRLSQTKHLDSTIGTIRNPNNSSLVAN